MVRMQIGMKYEVELFNGKGNFTLWQSTIINMLTIQGFDVTLEKDKLAKIKESEWKTMQKKIASQIQLALTPEVKCNVLSEMAIGLRIHIL